MNRGFASDNNSGVHPRVLEAIMEANHGHCSAYGDDPWTIKATELIQESFHRPLEVAFTYTGTGANILALASALEFGKAILCTQQAHILAAEAAAPERALGAQLVSIPSETGKLCCDRAREIILSRKARSPHSAQIGLVSVTQPNELGILYTNEELKSLRTVCNEFGIFLHIDGARLSNAAVALGQDLASACQNADILSFGGTKNGLLAAEAVIVFNPALFGRLKRLKKQFLQLPSKMRFVSCQFIPFLEEELWKSNAKHANLMARKLEQVIRKGPVLGGLLSIRFPVEVNMLFVSGSLDILKALRREVPFYILEEEPMPIARMVTSFDTIESDVTNLRALTNKAELESDNSSRTPQANV